MKVLFAVSNEKISEQIVKRYQKEYKKILTYKNVYYFNAIIKELQKDKSYDRIVISEDLEPFTSTNNSTIDKFVFEKLDTISDEAQDMDGKDTDIILICSEKRVKKSSLLLKLFSIGIYNALIEKDRSIEQVCNLINKPRSKKEAKSYYGIDSDEAKYKAESDSEVSEVEIQNILLHFKKISKNPEKFSSSFDNIASQYTDEQLKIIINCLPIRVKAVLERESDSYRKVAKNRVNYMSDLSNSDKLENTLNTEEGIKVNNIGQASTIMNNKEIVIPSAIKKSEKKRVVITNSSNVERKNTIKVKRDEQAERKVAQDPRREMQAERKVVQDPRREMQVERKVVQDPRREMQAERKVVQDPRREMQVERKVVQDPRREMQAERKVVQDPRREMQAERKVVQDPRREMQAERKVAQDPRREMQAERKVAQDPRREMQAERKVVQDSRIEADIDRTMIEETKREVELVKEESIRNINSIENLETNKEELMVEEIKKGRGRPRKYPISTEVKPKGKRGRPKKLLPNIDENQKEDIDEEIDVEESLFSVENEQKKIAFENKGKIDLTEINEIDNEDEYILPSFEDEEDEAELPSFEDEEDELELPSFEDEEDEAELPSFEDEEDEMELPSFEDEEDEMELPSFEDEEDELELPSFEDEEDEAELPSFEDEEDEVELPSFEDEEDEMSLPSFEDEEDEMSLPSFEDEEDEMELPSFEDEEDEAELPSFEDEEDELELPSFEDEEDEAELPSFEDEEDELELPSFEDEEDEMSLPSFEDEEDEMELPSFEDEEDEMELPSFEDEEDEMSLPSFEDEEDEMELPSFEDEEDEMELPSFEDEEELPSFEDEEDEAELPSFEDEEDEVELPSFEDEEDEMTLPSFEDEEDEAELPSFEDEEDEAELPSFEDEEDEAELPSFEDEEDEVELPSFEDEEDESVIPTFKENVKENREDKKVPSIKSEVNYSMSVLNSLMTKDKKIVNFLGTSKNGTSFLVNNLAAIFDSMGINTAILDMTKNKNSYYIYTNNEERLRKIAYKSINNLKNGFAEGLKVGKNLTVYTSVPNEEIDESNAEAILSTLVQNHSLILIDCDFDTDPAYFAMCQELYLVQSMDVLTIQPLTKFLRDLKTKGVLDSEKIRVVVNKEVKMRTITSKDIIGGLSFYNDPSMSFMTDLFNKDLVKACTIPFDEGTYSRYLDGVAVCKISMSGYTKNFMSKLKILAEMVYPRVPQGNNQYNKKNTNYGGNGFSPNVNSTLEQMRKKY